MSQPATKAGLKAALGLATLRMKVRLGLMMIVGAFIVGAAVPRQHWN